MVDREIRVNVRVSDEEAKMLWELAESEGLSQSDFFRTQLRKAYAAKFGDKKPRGATVTMRKR